jgi:hypothetical protein|eukprot:COSAG02_NODE_584_length_19995_cov_3.209439_7_plen_217_part_00
MRSIGWPVLTGQVLDAKTIKEGEDGWIVSAPEYTAYDIQVTRPEGTETVITKRYSDFTELKTKLAVTEVRNGMHALSQRCLHTIALPPFRNRSWTERSSVDKLCNGRVRICSVWLAAQEAKQAEIASLDFATWTFTKAGSMHEDTINDRKTKLGSWLNAVLFLCRTFSCVFFSVGVAALRSCATPASQLDRVPQQHPNNASGLSSSCCSQPTQRKW